jgi:hypothetical protein
MTPGPEPVDRETIGRADVAITLVARRQIDLLWSYVLLATEPVPVTEDGGVSLLL